jgi:hypothetical protein
MSHICAFCQAEFPTQAELSQHQRLTRCHLTLPSLGVEPDKKASDEPPAEHLFRLILPPHSVQHFSALQIEALVSELTRGHGKVVNVQIVCDQCGELRSYILAEVATTRRKCSRCARFYDMCNACMGTAECCPWCGELDLWW